MQKKQQNKTSLVQSPPIDTRPGNEVGLFYNAPEPTQVRAMSPDCESSRKVVVDGLGGVS